MILGRSPNLALGALTTLFNIVVVFHLGGFAPSIEQIGAVNIGLGAVIAFVSNSASIQIAAGRAAADRLP